MMTTMIMESMHGRNAISGSLGYLLVFEADDLAWYLLRPILKICINERRNVISTVPFGKWSHQFEEIDVYMEIAYSSLPNISNIQFCCANVGKTNIWFTEPPQPLLNSNHSQYW
jgi:hypothetical protein